MRSAANTRGILIDLAQLLLNWPNKKSKGFWLFRPKCSCWKRFRFQVNSRNLCIKHGEAVFRCETNLKKSNLCGDKTPFNNQTNAFRSTGSGTRSTRNDIRSVKRFRPHQKLDWENRSIDIRNDATWTWLNGDLSVECKCSHSRHNYVRICLILNVFESRIGLKDGLSFLTWNSTADKMSGWTFLQASNLTINQLLFSEIRIEICWGFWSHICIGIRHKSELENFVLQIHTRKEFVKRPIWRRLFPRQIHHLRSFTGYVRVESQTGERRAPIRCYGKLPDIITLKMLSL
jgi:hypothetical protein